jgi:hypothetical protein
MENMLILVWLIQKINKDKIFKNTKSKLEVWRKDGINEKTIKEYYQLLDKMIVDEYMKLFGI